MWPSIGNITAHERASFAIAISTDTNAPKYRKGDIVVFKTSGNEDSESDKLIWSEQHGLLFGHVSQGSEIQAMVYSNVQSAPVLLDDAFITLGAPIEIRRPL